MGKKRLKKHPTLYVLLGLPGSGKSTFAERMAKEPRVLVVSRDQIRIALKLRYCFDMAYEDLVAELADTMLSEVLGRGFDAVMDETHIQLIRRMAVTENALRACPKVKIIYVGFIARDYLKNRMKSPRDYRVKDWKRIIERMEKGRNPVDTKLEHFHEFWLTRDAGRHFVKGKRLASNFWKT